MEGERDGETGRQTDRQTGIARICRVSCALLCCLCFVVYEWERETSNGDSGNPQSPSLSLSLFSLCLLTYLNICIFIVSQAHVAPALLH